MWKTKKIASSLYSILRENITRKLSDSYQTIFLDFIHFRAISKTYISFRKDMIMNMYVSGFNKFHWKKVVLSESKISSNILSAETGKSLYVRQQCMRIFKTIADHV